MLRSPIATRSVLAHGVSQPAYSVRFEPAVLEECELPPIENADKRLGFGSRRIAIKVQVYPTGLLVRGFGKAPVTA